MPNTQYATIIHKVFRHEESTDVSMFCEKVTDALRNGWQLQGGVSTSYNGDYYLFVQAIAKPVANTCAVNADMTVNHPLDVELLADQIANIVKRRQ